MRLIKKLPVNLRQFIFFGIAGATGFLISSTILMVFIKALHFHPIPARIFSYLPAVTMTWYLNRSLTFSVTHTKSKFKEWLRYISANWIGTLLNFTIYSALILFAIGFFSHPLVALAISCGCSMFFNFFAAKYYSFRITNEPSI